MNLSEHEISNEPATLYLRDPITGEPDPDGAYLLVVSKYSDAYRKFENRINQKRIVAARQTGQVIPSADEIADDAVARSAALVVGVENLFIGSEKVVFSYETIKGLIQKYGWLRDQLTLFAENQENFTVRA